MAVEPAAAGGCTVAGAAASEASPVAVAEAILKRAGRPKAADKAVPVSLRVPPDVLAAFKAAGPGWQTRMNEALAAAAIELRKSGAP